MKYELALTSAVALVGCPPDPCEIRSDGDARVVVDGETITDEYNFAAISREGPLPCESDELCVAFGHRDEPEECNGLAGASSTFSLHLPIARQAGGAIAMNDPAVRFVFFEDAPTQGASSRRVERADVPGGRPEACPTCGGNVSLESNGEDQTAPLRLTADASLPLLYWDVVDDWTLSIPCADITGSISVDDGVRPAVCTDLATGEQVVPCGCPATGAFVGTVDLIER
ncbi:MAG: hypothetical protein HYS27_17115 [Deltaproteobacteria bacterium]|nr:hypothetical protein [Deltaproteobacteria bacterium]